MLARNQHKHLLTHATIYKGGTLHTSLLEPKLSRVVVLCTCTPNDRLVLAKTTACELCLCPKFAASNLSLSHRSSSASFGLSNCCTVIRSQRTTSWTYSAAQNLIPGTMDTPLARSGRVQSTAEVSSPCLWSPPSSCAWHSVSPALRCPRAPCALAGTRSTSPT